MYNKITLVGNLTKDLELRYTPVGSAIATTGIATSHKYKAQDGTQKEDICFVDLAFFGKSAEIANQYLRKGSKCLIDGRLKLDIWEDKNGGGKRSKHSVIVETMKMLDSKPKDEQYQPKPQQYHQQPKQEYKLKQKPKYEQDEDDISEEIPF